MDDFDLYAEMCSNNDIIYLLCDDDIAREFYGALCNRRWVKIMSEEEEVIEMLTYGTKRSWACTWRSAGAYIASIRNKYYNKNEDYMFFYPNGNEGIVTERVKEEFKKMGWTSEEYDN